MTLEDLKKEFKKKGRIVTLVVDYDERFIVVEAVKSLTEVSYDDPYYIIEKKTGKTAPFSIAADPKKFFKAAETRTLFSMKKDK